MLLSLIRDVDIFTARHSSSPVVLVLADGSEGRSLSRKGAGYQRKPTSEVVGGRNGVLTIALHPLCELFREGHRVPFDLGFVVFPAIRSVTHTARPIPFATVASAHGGQNLTVRSTSRNSPMTRTEITTGTVALRTLQLHIWDISHLLMCSWYTYTCTHARGGSA